jgi:iron complex outermembrane recepter protein
MRLSVVVAITCLSIIGVATADNVTAAIRKPTSIPAQELGTALKTLAKDRGFQIAYVSDEVNSVRTPGVSGELTIEEALTGLLNGTGLTYRYFGDNAVSIVPIASGAPSDASSQDQQTKPTANTSWLGRLRLAAEQGTGPSPPASSSTSEEEQPSLLQEVVVTATRRAESVEKVPLSINALSQDELAAGGIKDIADIAAITPGLQYSLPNGFSSANPAISIRGLNTNTGASTVGIYLDDTPLQTRASSLANQGSPFPFVFDLNRVEVARGPQGTLFGAGAEAGTVRFITNSPSLTTFSGYSHGEIASTDGGAPSYEIGAAAGGPIVQDAIGFRASVWDRRDGGYISRIDPITDTIVAGNTNSNEKYVLNLALALRVNDDVRISPSVYYQQIHQDDSQRFYGNFSDPSEGVFVYGRLLPEVWTDHWALPSLKIEAHLPFAELTATTSYLDRTVFEPSLDSSSIICAGVLGTCGSPLGTGFPSSPLDVAVTPSGLSVRGLSQEVRLASNDPNARVSWVGGVFYDHRVQWDWQTTYDQAADPTAPTLSAANIQDNHERFIDKQIAAFAQGDIHLTSQLTGTLGLRVAHVETDVRELSGTGVPGAPLPLLNAGALPVAYASDKETPTTPRVALSYQLDPNDLFYVSAGKGFRPGGGNAAAPCFDVPPAFKSDYVWSYEAGAKNKVFDGRLQIDSSVFHINWYNIQQYISLPCDAAYTTNLGNAESNGFDLAMQAAVTEHLRANLDVGYVNAFYTKSAFDNSGNPLDLAGDKIGLVPQVNAPWNVNTSADYVIPLQHDDKIHMRGEYRYTSRNPGPFITQNTTSQNYYPLVAPDPPTHLFNARLGATLDHLDFTLFVNNVFNSHPPLGKYQDVASSNLVTYLTFRPRTIGLAVNYDFGK